MILVTGADGFIGQHLVRELRDAGHDVLGVDRDEGDLSQPGVAQEVLEEYEPRIVVHLAAQVGRQFCDDEPTWAITSNASMTALVAQATASVGAELVYCSTSEIYGDHGDALCHEDTPPGRVHGIYSLTKRWGEEVARLYAPRNLKILRPSMPYGPGAPPGRGRRALDNMLWQAYHRMEIPVHMGAQRSWCWIGDAVRGMRLVIERGGPGAYNVGRDDADVSMLVVADKAVDLARAPRSLIRMVQAPPNQTVVKRLDTSRLRALGWRPEVDLDEGMARVYDWVQLFDRNGNCKEAA